MTETMTGMIMDDATTEPTLVIDTSYGSTVAVVGCDPVVEPDSRAHVERLQPNIAEAVCAAGLSSESLGRVVVGTGPAPFTGLRAGIVAARAVGYVTGAEVVGQDVLEPQAVWMAARQAGDGVGNVGRRLVLAVNDARRRQLYYRLYDVTDTVVSDSGVTCLPVPLCDMDIAYPDSVVEQVNSIVCGLPGAVSTRVDVVGHGVDKYMASWSGLGHFGTAVEGSVLHDAGARGPALFAAVALAHRAQGDACPTDPLYLRRPDVSVPKPLKHVLNHSGAERSER